MTEPGAAGPGYVLDLKEAGRADPGQVGEKAARLGELLAADFPVPEGKVLSTRAFERVLSANGFGKGPSPEAVLGAKLPPDVKEAILSIGASLGGPLAVRSSGVAEDLSGASFAGQYETVLGVDGAGALEGAVLRCWSSAFAPRVAAYRKSAKAVGDAPMAVLIQRLVKADSSGVAFTANPVTGEKEVVINSVKGLGERLVSGRATPDEWVVKGGTASCRRGAEGALTAEQAREVAELSREVEKRLGPPQDVEWAFEGRTLFLLQARPITTLSGGSQDTDLPPVKIEVPEGFWQREEVSFPHPLKPIDESVIPESVEVIARLCRELALPFEKMDIRSIGGWVYVRIVPPGGKDRSPPPAWLIPILFRVVPQMRTMAKRNAEMVRTDAAGRTVDAWYGQWRPELDSTARRLREVDLAGLSDQRLDEQLSDAIRFYFRCFEVHFRTILTIFQPLYAFAMEAERLLGYDDKRVVEMLGGLSRQSAEPSRKMAELAGLALRDPDVRSLFRGELDEDALEKLDRSGEFGRAFSAYRREYGSRTVAYEFGSKTLAEDPLLLLRLIRDQMTRGFAEADSAVEQGRQAAVSEARAKLKSGEDLREFERLYARAARAYPTLDDTQFYVCLSRGQVRFALLEAGRRLARRGAVEREEDVFYLRVDEVREALRGGVGDFKGAVKQRRQGVSWAEAHPGPKSYGVKGPPPPSLDAFPKELQFVARAFAWGFERFMSTPVDNKPGSTVRGVGASSGRYTGPVRVVAGEEDFHKVMAGDVLVCPITSPVWSVLFPSIGALVTDRGGILSHPAILAREYHLPAVVATGSGTQLLRDGMAVTVDGDKGEVTIVGGP